MQYVKARISRSFGKLILETPYVAEYVNALKTVIPSQFRDYTGNGLWAIDPRYFSCALALYKHFFGDGYIDSTNGVAEPQVSDWKERWEVWKTTSNKRGEKENPRQPPRSSQSSNAFSVLYVTSNAPPEVIKAVYRTLASIHHPDKGGDLAVMQQINAAYEELKRKGLV
jgi:hypothetical protein